MPPTAPADAERSTACAILSHVESLVLALVAEKPSHGFAISRLTAADGPLGRIYRVRRPIVYRALDRLVSIGLVYPARVEAGDRGPQRTLFSATPAGEEAVLQWLCEPVRHSRDVRTELLLKLAILDRARSDPGPLLRHQREVLIPIIEGLAGKCGSTEGFDRALATWRYECARATLRFIDHQLEQPSHG